MYEPCWSKIGSSKESLWQCKYKGYVKYKGMYRIKVCTYKGMYRIRVCTVPYKGMYRIRVCTVANKGMCLMKAGQTQNA